MSLVKTHNLPTLKHSQKEGTLTLLLSSPLGRSAGRSLLLGHAPCVMFPPPARGAALGRFRPSFPAGPRGDSFCACVLRRWAPRRCRRPPPPPPGGPSCACALALPPSRCARLSQSVCRSLSAEQEERRGFGEAAAGLFAFPSLSPAPHLSLPLSCPRSRSHGGAVGGHSVPISVLVVLRGRAVRARRQRRELGSLPRHGGEELRLLLCG